MGLHSDLAHSGRKLAERDGRCKATSPGQIKLPRLDLGLHLAEASRALNNSDWIIEYDSTTLGDIGGGHLPAGLH